MIDAKLAADVERAVVNSARQQQIDDAMVQIASDICRILSASNNADPSTVISASVMNGVQTAVTRLDRVRIAVTGTGWIGGGIGSVEDVMLNLLRAAQHEVLLTAYSITTGSSRVIDQIEQAVATGVRTRLIVDRFDEQEATVRRRLEGLARQFPASLTIHDFADGTGRSHLHAKTLVIDRRKAVVGSANMTFHGMMLAHELAVILEGPTVELIAQRIDLLLQSTLVRDACT